MTNSELSSILLRDSFSIIKKEKEISIYILSSIVINMCLSTAIFIISIFFVLNFHEYLNAFLFIILIILIRLDVFGLVPYIVSNFFLVAIISAVYKNMYAGQPSLGEGIVIAKDNLGKIVRWSFFDKFYLLGIQFMRVIGRKTPHPTEDYSYPILLDPVWNVMKYLIPAIMVIENKGVFEAVERAGYLSVDNWRIHILGTFKFINFILILGIFISFSLIVFVFRTSEHLPLLIASSAILIVLFVTLSILKICLFTVYGVLCYQYSVTGEIPSRSILAKIDSQIYKL